MNASQRMRILSALLLAAACIVAGGCGGDDDSAGATGAPPPPSMTEVGGEASRLTEPKVRRYRRSMAAACRRARREIDSGGVVASTRGRAARARRQHRAYARLGARLRVLTVPRLVRGPALRYRRGVVAAVALTDLIVVKAEAQPPQQRQVTRLVEELRANAGTRDRIADGLRVDAC